MTGPRVAFLFLGETLLIPHLYPVVEALAAEAPDVAIDAWVATDVHEELIAGWSRDLPSVAVRRVPGFRRTGLPAGHNPPLPPKLPTLLRLLPHLWRADAVVCAEQTSLWLPSVVPMRARFVDLLHGAGTMRAKGNWRRHAAWRTLVASERERDALLALGDAAGRVAAVGYVKAAFRQRSPARRWFADDRPIILYNPHWQRHRSSWWTWGRALVERLVAQDRFNVILAPHQRLVERAPEVRGVLAAAAAAPHVHADLDSFATVDGSYAAAADIYLGDTSSQVLEFAARPRPCVFLNGDGVDWQADPSYAQWRLGEVIDRLDDLSAGIDRAVARQPERAAAQAALVAAQLGATDGEAGRVAARHVLAAIDSRHVRKMG